MTHTNNTFEIGARVERLGSASDYTTGRKGEIVDIKDGRCRVKWDGNVRTWVAQKFLRVIEPAAKPVLTVDELAFMAWIGEMNAKAKQWVKDGEEGKLADDYNPAYMFSTMPTKLLAMIVKGEINATFMAGRELANRGQDKDGTWVGFDKAAEIHHIK